jgi:hypothetical protein
VVAHPDAQKGGTTKKKFGDNCVSSQTVAAHPDAQKGGTANKKFGDNCVSSQAVFNSLSLAAPPMDLLGSYPEASGLAPRITPTGMRNLNEEAVAESGGNSIVTLDQSLNEEAVAKSGGNVIVTLDQNAENPLTEKTSRSEYASGTMELMQPPLAQGGCISLVLQERASHSSTLWTTTCRS